MSKQKKIKLGIIGDRTVNDFSLVQKGLDFAQIQKEQLKEILTGDDAGINSSVRDYCKFYSVKCKEYKPDWKNIKAKDAIIADGKYGKYNKKAAINRNDLIIKDCDILLIIDYSNSKSLENLVKKAKELSKVYHVYELDQDDSQQDKNSANDDSFYKF